MRNSHIITILLFSFLSTFSQKSNESEKSRLKNLAKKVTIIRDNWGIAHVYGKTDADAVFGMLYAQCEDDFKRVEMNYIEKLGRLSEIKGESYFYNDLQIKLLISEADAKKDYKNAKPWLKKLLNAFADGINFYLLNNPKVEPKLLKHFEPWFPLLWTDGSIGAISTADLSLLELQQFYGSSMSKIAYTQKEIDVQTGSNGFAIAPIKTVSGNSILYINPHTSFYFRPEIQIESQEGLKAYGAVTWGQFFIYQGFNENCGWMHTSSNVDVADLYEEKIIEKNKKLWYEYDDKLLPLQIKNIVVKYIANNKILSKSVKTFATNHGPIMAVRNGKWISLKSNNRNVGSLIQSWQRTKSVDFKAYQNAMDLKANTSNNTVYADKFGNIAYWHGNYVPKRDLKYNWAAAVDGSTSKTEWQGLHAVSEAVHLYNPENGWLQNCNSTPFSVAGKRSPKKENYPSYMAPDGENFRAVNAVRLLEQPEKLTLDQVIKIGYDSKLSIFELLLPKLIECFENNYKPDTTVYNELIQPIKVLKLWDYYAKSNSVATTLANEWAFKINPIVQKTYINQGAKDQIENTNDFIKNAEANDLIPQLQLVVSELKSKFGTWEIPWGELNRFQRSSDALDLVFDDAKESLSNGNASVLWGCLPAFKSNYQNNTKKRYGFNGNSFVCAVEFGKKIKAKSLLAGGNSGNFASKHFLDQAENYQNGIFKEVYFYKEDVTKNAEKTYHPGE